VGTDTASFGRALRRVLRQDPDVILIGEIRDAESAQMALSAAETGHLVLSTLHTVDATETINRLIDLFPTHERNQVRTMIAGTLKGIFCVVGWSSGVRSVECVRLFWREDGGVWRVQLFARLARSGLV
jgi:Tfp pilus assembly pilus retraction ATPase PilT